MKSDIVAFRLLFCLPSLLLSGQRYGCDPAAAPIPPFGTRDVEWSGERGCERGGKNRESRGGMPGKLSSVSDGDRVGKYLNWHGGVVGDVMSDSLWDKDAGGCIDSTCLLEIDEEFRNNKEWGEYNGPN